MIEALFIVLLIYCIYRFIDDNIYIQRTVRFFEEEKNINRYNEKVEYIKRTLTGQYTQETLDQSIPKIYSVSDFYDLSLSDRNFVVEIVKSILDENE